MSDNINENKEQNNNLEKNPNKNTVHRSQNTLDLGSMMQLASTLLNNDVIMNSVTEQLSKDKPITATQAPKVSGKSENLQISTLYEKIQTVANGISEIKDEYKGLAILSINMEKLTTEISELTKVLKEVKEQQTNLNADAEDNQ